MALYVTPFHDIKDPSKATLDELITTFNNTGVFFQSVSDCSALSRFIAQLSPNHSRLVITHIVQTTIVYFHENESKRSRAIVILCRSGLLGQFLRFHFRYKADDSLCLFLAIINHLKSTYGETGGPKVDNVIPESFSLRCVDGRHHSPMLISWVIVTTTCAIYIDKHYDFYPWSESDIFYNFIDFYGKVNGPARKGEHVKKTNKNIIDDISYTVFAYVKDDFLPDSKISLGKVVSVNALLSCPICLCGDNTTMHEMPCGHIYHELCIGEWCKTNESCPECRETFASNLLSTIN